MHTTPSTLNVTPKQRALSLRNLRLYRLPLFLGLLLLLALSTTSCKDAKKQCKQLVDKYQTCTQAMYKKGEKLHKQLAPAAQKRSAAMLAQLKKKLYSPDWRKRQMATCMKKPPSSSRFNCVQKSPCNELSKCDPNAQSLSPKTSQPKTQPKKR